MNEPFQAVKITDRVYWVGAIDWTLREFHGYRTQRGSTYNAYIVLADQITLIDTVKAPFFEEMIFRGLMLRALSKVSPKFGIIASAALFGIFHQNIPQAVNAFLIGLALGYAAYKSGSIIPGIIIHFVLNANGIIQEGIASKSETAAGIVFILLAIIFVACAIAIIIANRKKISLPVVSEQTKGRTFPVFITSVPVIIALIGEIALTLTSIQKM